MRGFVALCIVAFCAGLGAVVATRLSDEAVTVLAAVVVGVLAGLPTAILALVAMRVARRSGAEERPPAPAPHYPPVIVVGGAPPLPPAQPNGAEGAWRELEPPRRAFRVLGEDDSERG